MCPDNSLKRKRSSRKPECPCLCKDNTEKEMKPDGSCPVINNNTWKLTFFCLLSFNNYSNTEMVTSWQEITDTHAQNVHSRKYFE